MLRVLRRLVVDEKGQELVEYALLAAFVVLATIVALQNIEGAMRNAYVSWNTAMLGCWKMPAPGAGGC